MPAINFITALGRVLHDGALRDAFARDAGTFVKSINLRESDQAAFLQLSPAELEVQAHILLRKRFDPVRRLLPRTCQTLGPSAWQQFVVSLRSGGTHGAGAALHDAYQFCIHLVRVHPRSVCEVELNRCRFANRRNRFSLHFVHSAKNGGARAIQLLIRFRAQQWREWQFYFGV